MIERIARQKLKTLLADFPCVAILGPRQVGKTTLAKEVAKEYPSSLYLDLESISDLNKLSDAEMYLKQFSDRMIILDEVQHVPHLFPILRSLIDAHRIPARFLLLGSAGEELLNRSSESLAGRIAFLELTPFLCAEIPPERSLDDLWFYGGFPDPFLKPAIWHNWMENFIRTYMERDLPALGFPAPPLLGKRLWILLSHLHGNILHYAELSRSLEVSIHTVKSYLEFLEKAFLIRILPPYHTNIGKRLVKAPKVYLRDSGILHFLLGFDYPEQVYHHPKLGASWEGFVVEQILAQLPAGRKAFFYRTHDGAELDLVIARGDRVTLVVEIRFGSDSRPSRGNTEGFHALENAARFVVNHSDDDYEWSNNVRVCGLRRFLATHLKQY